MTDAALKPGSRIVAAMAMSVCASNETVRRTVSSEERPELKRGAGKP
jgi:hypothetical protein